MGASLDNNANKKLYSLYYYDLSNLDKSKKVRFVYALKGRGAEEGIIKRLDGEFLVPGGFIIPIKNDKEILDVLKLWRVRYKKKSIMLID